MNSKEFSFSTIENFDEHIESQIRGYNDMSRIIKELSRFAIEDSTNVYDIGASTGRFITELANQYYDEEDEAKKKKVNFIGIEPNSNFQKDFPTTENVHLSTEKVTRNTKFINASFITSMFTLQFIPAQERQPILDNIYTGLNPNGIFIWCERVFSNDSQIEKMLNHIHHKFKLETMHAQELIDKDEALTTIMRPYSFKKNVRMLEQAGFEQIDIFWKVNNFLGIIAIK